MNNMIQNPIITYSSYNFHEQTNIENNLKKFINKINDNFQKVDKEIQKIYEILTFYITMNIILFIILYAKVFTS